METLGQGKLRSRDLNNRKLEEILGEHEIPMLLPQHMRAVVERMANGKSRLSFHW